jgi:hypothetical protein
MAQQDTPRAQTGTGRLANTSANPSDTSAHPGVEKPIAGPAQEVAEGDFDANPLTVAGDEDEARIVPPVNQGDASEVTDKIVGGEAGATVY